MAGYQQSVYGQNTAPRSSYNAERSEPFDPPLPPSAVADMRPGETWQEYFKRKGIPNIDEQPFIQKTDAVPPPPTSTEEDWLVGPPSPDADFKQTPEVDRRTVGAIEGAPWFERLKSSVLFDSESTENWLADKYGDEYVFRDSDDALYFLPPEEQGKSEDAQTWVRFNPEGLDTGDFVEFVPGLIAGIAASAVLYVTGGTGAIPSMAAAGAAGATSDIALQGAGALMSDESHVPMSERAVRAGFAGTMEAATAGAGMLGSQLVKSGREALRSGGRAVAEMGTDPAEAAARKSVMERTGAPFSIGQETSGTQPLLLERFGRQNVLTSDIAREADEAIGEHLQGQAEAIVRQVFAEGGELGADAAINAHKLRLEHMTRERRNEWNMLFDAARMAAGDARVVETSNIRSALKSIRSDEASHVPPGAADEIISNVNRGLKKLGSGKATITQLKNALAQYGRIAYDGRGYADKILSPSVQKSISKKVLDALRKDLALTINKARDVEASNIQSQIAKLTSIRDELGAQIDSVSERLSVPPGGMDLGEAKKRLAAQESTLRTRHTKVSEKLSELDDRLNASSKAKEAAALLDKARQRFRVLSEEINEVLENPLTRYGENPEALIREVFRGSPGTTDGRRVRKIMEFLDEVSPEAASRFRAQAVEHILERSANITSSNLDDAVVSADKLVTAAVRNRRTLNALFEGDKRAHDLLRDFVKTAQVMKDRGPIYGSQTFSGNLIMGLTGVTAAASSVAGNVSFDDMSTSGEGFATDAAKLAAAVFGTRAVARSLFRQQHNSAMRKLLRMMRIKMPGPGARKAMRQAALDVLRPEATRATADQNRDTKQQQDDTLTPEQQRTLERRMRFIPGGP